MRAAPGPAGHLAQELEGPLSGTEVRQVQAGVGADHSHQRHLGDVETLGHQARADQDVQLAAGEGVDDALRGAASLHHVSVETAHAQRREARRDLVLQALGPAAEVADPRRTAGRAAPRHRPAPPAVVAAQRHPGGVVDERPLAVGTGLDMAAVPAEHHRRRAAAVDQQDRPIPGTEVQRGERARQPGRDEAAVAGRQLGPQIDDLHRGRPPAGALDERNTAVHPRPGQSHALHRRRGAPQQDRGAGQPPEPERHVARLVARRAVLLIARVVLFVHHDDARVPQRGEKGDARPDDDVDGTGADAPPLVGPLATGEAAVKERHLGAEVGTQPVDQRHGHGDLRDEHERGPAACQRGGDRLDVDGGLAGAGRPVEQDRRRVAPIDRLARQRERGRLFRQQGRARRTGAARTGWSGRQRIACHRHPLHLQQPATHQAGDRGVPVAPGERGRRDSLGRR